MAERVEELCMDFIGCGKRTVTGQRRLLGTPESVNVVEALHMMLVKRVGYDFDQNVILRSFVCIKCFGAYTTYSKKGLELYNKTSEVADHLKSLTDHHLLNPPPTKRPHLYLYRSTLIILVVPRRL